MSWDEFKEFVSKLDDRKFLFRGQNGAWRLRTSYHRRGRADLNIFVSQDIPALLRNLSARTKHYFNLAISELNGAFYNLVQHHGYPTPLLDWSYSPYVAAYFAYRGVSNKEANACHEDEKVKVFIFDQAQWRKDFKQSQNLLSCGLHVSVHEFIALENERLVPQQAVSTVTNIDDTEGYIHFKESQNGKNYLTAITLQKKNRQQVVRELSYMGITAGSLFPGLDGACEELRERYFSS